MMTLVIGCLNNKNSVIFRPAGKLAVVERGYSLLELMIVMVVIGVVTSIAALSFSNFGAGAGEKVLERLRYDVQLISNESIVRSEVLALAFHSKGYAFMRLDDDAENWEIIEKDRFLKPREFEAPLNIRMIIAENELTLGDSVGEPQVISLPTGEVTPFIYHLESEAEDYSEQLKFDALGRVIKDEETEGKSGDESESTAS